MLKLHHFVFLYFFISARYLLNKKRYFKKSFLVLPEVSKKQKSSETRVN